MCTINQDHMMYGSWAITCKGQSFFVSVGHFLPFDPPNNPKNQNSGKIKKTLEISFYTCVPQMTIERDRHNFLPFYAIFCLLSLYQPKKWKFEKNEKNTWKYHHLHKFTKIMIMCNTVSEIWHITDVIVIFLFGLFFLLLPP